MADYILVLGSIAILTCPTLLAWRRKAGPSRSRGRMIGRAALAVSLASLIVGVGTYHISKSRSFQIVGGLVPRVETTEKVIALTFDDGPAPKYTEEILSVLRTLDAPATFYLTGRECDNNPELLRAIIDAGHEIGNHTYSHRRLYFTPEATVAREVERTDAIFRAAGYDGPVTFRMPGCKRLLTTPIYLTRNKRTTVTWDLEPDSIAGVADSSDAIVDYVVDNARPGSIVLMHVMYDSRESTRKALPRILEQLSAEGYRFVTVSEMLALR